MRICARSIIILSIVAAPALAQAPADPKVPAKAVDAKQLSYQVIAITGKVRVAKFGADPQSDVGWRPVKKGELLGRGLQILTSMRSKLKLAAYPNKPPTVILIEQLSLVGINDLRFEGGAAKSRLGLGYGAIRAGVAEGEIRSDMKIECPTATLSKKGTDIFRFEYRNNRWSMSLSPLGRGQIRAIQNRYSGIVGGRRWTSGSMRTRNVFPGQLVTQAMARTIDTTAFSRNINVQDAFGLQDIEIKLLELYGNGRGVRLLGGNAIDVQNPNQGSQLTGAGQMSTSTDMGRATGVNTFLRNIFDQFQAQNAVRPHPGGDFGIGQLPFIPIGGQTATQRSITGSALQRANMKKVRMQAFSGHKRK
ncbi:MAG: hypothetical protein O7B26_01130 [Planctomycetota bacterium]|nr:hypothetical protein [Planctomycetota bacterium]